MKDLASTFKGKKIAKEKGKSVIRMEVGVDCSSKDGYEIRRKNKRGHFALKIESKRTKISKEIF